MPFDFIAGQKIKDERYKDIPMVIAPEYMETYLQDMEKKKRLKVNPHLQTIRDNRETPIPHNLSNKPMKRKLRKNQGKIQPLNQDSKPPMPTKTAGAIFSQPWD